MRRVKQIPVSLTGLDAVVDLELLDGPARRALFQLQGEGECILVPLRAGFVGLIAIDTIPEHAEPGGST